MGKKNKIDYPLILIFLAGLFLRLWGITHDLPHHYYIDESGLIYDSLKMGSGDLNPHYFIYPTLWYYVLLSVFAAYYLFGRLFHIFSGAASFILAYLKDPSVFFLLGRSLSTIAGSLLVIFTYRLCRTLYDRNRGLLAGLIVACSPLLVENSHYAIVDVPMTSLLVLSYLPLSRILLGGRRSDYLKAGACIGLAAAVKYTALTALVSLCYVHLLSPAEKDRGGKKKILSVRLGMAMLATLVAFLAVCPFPIVDSRAFFRDIIYQWKCSRVGWFGWEATNRAFGMFLTSVLPQGMGILTFILSILGILLSLWRREKAGGLLLSFLIPYMLIIGNSRLTYSRYMLPLIPFLAVFSAYLIHELAHPVKHRKRLVLTGLAFIFLLPSLKASWETSQGLNLAHTFTLARDWVAKNVPSGKRILIDSNLAIPYNLESLERLQQEKLGVRKQYGYRTKTDWYFELKKKALDPHLGYMLREVPHPVGYLAGEGDFTQEWITLEMARQILEPGQYDYIIISKDAERHYQREEAKHLPERFRFIAEFYQKIHEYPLTQELAPRAGHSRGPVVKIYRVTTDPPAAEKS